MENLSAVGATEREGAVGNGNEGTVRNKVGSAGGRWDAVEEHDTMLGRAYGRCLLPFFRMVRDVLLVLDVEALPISLEEAKS